MVAHVNRYDWRTNLSASVNGRIVISEPREGIVTRVNWWNYNQAAEGGDILASDLAALVEGPLPDGENGQSLGANQNSLRDDDAINVLMLAAPASGLTTSVTVRFHPHYTFPGGIWSVEAIWAFMVTSSGVDRVMMSIGFERVKVSMNEWTRLRHSSPNFSTAGELRQ